jgi:hypothetical protein
MGVQWLSHGAPRLSYSACEVLSMFRHLKVLSKAFVRRGARACARSLYTIELVVASKVADGLKSLSG